MAKIKVAVISDTKNKCHKNELLKFLKTKKFDVIDLNKKETNNILHECEKLQTAIITGKVNRAIVIDDYGIAPFMFLSKKKNFVVAEISDEHSAIMTADHNGSNVLSFGSKILTIDLMKSMAISFLNKKYSGGRHQSRIDMMNDLLAKEA